MKKYLLLILLVLVFPVNSFCDDIVYILNDDTYYPSVQCTGAGVPYSWCTEAGEVPRPPKGTAYTDTVYHTEIVRITDAATETIGGSSQKDYAQSGYPKHDIENSDGTMLLVQAEAGSGWYLYNALGVPQTIHGTEYPAYGQIKMIPINTIGYVGRQDCRWSKTDPNVFYYIGGLTRLGEQGKIVKYTIGVTDAVEIVYDTKLDSDWASITCTGVGTPVYWCTGVGTPSGYGGAGPTLQEEGDGDSSGHYFAYAMSGSILYGGSTITYYKGAIVIDVTTGTLVSKILSLCPEFYGGGAKYSACLNPLWVQNPGYTAMSPNGDYVLFGDVTKLYSRDFLTRYTYYVGNGHSDVAVDATGRDVWVGAVHYKAAGDIERYWATMIDIATGELFHLAPIGPYSCNYHVSGNAVDKPGWAIFSTFDAAGDQSQWYVQQIMAIELTRSYPAPTLASHAKIWRLADSHMVKVSYKDDMFAKFNKKGTKVWFTSGWHTSYSQIRSACTPPCQTNLFQINLPTNWWTDLGGVVPSPPVAPVLALPLNEAVDVITAPTLSWSASTGATSYIAVVATDSAFSNVIYGPAGTSNLNIYLPTLLESTTYYWKVKASNLGGTSDYSAYRSFTTHTSVAIPAVPVLSSPANAATGVVLSPTLSWVDSTGATSYTVRVATDAGFTNIVSGPTVTTNLTLLIEVLLEGKVYYWQAKASNASGSSEYSTAWSFTTQPSLGQVTPVAGYRNLFITSYYWDDASDPSIIGPAYDLIVTKYWNDYDVSVMKGLNPNLTTLFYQDVLDISAITSYYILNQDTGNKVHRNSWEWELHDIGNASYRSELTTIIANRMIYYTDYFHGVFLDDVLHDLVASEFHDAVTGAVPTFLASDVTNWRANMVLLLRAIKTAVGTKLVIANTNFYRSDFIAEIDGIMDEWFAHPNWAGPTDWDLGGFWKDSVDYMISIIASNKYFLAQSGTSSGTDTQINSLSKFCYASFLMGVGSNVSYAKHYFIPTMTYAQYYWYSIWQIAMGNPTGAYAQISAKNSYRRNFTNGVVIVNPSANTETITLERYYLKDGVYVNSFEITGYEGVFLKSQTGFVGIFSGGSLK